MDAHTRAMLRRIGDDLDRSVFPRVSDGGIVMPGDPAVTTTPGGELRHDQREGTREDPGAGAPEGAQGAPARAPAAGPAAPLFGAALEDWLKAELDGVQHAYPGVRAWRPEDGSWLLCRAGVLPDLGRAAIFLLGFAYDTGAMRGWGFWERSAVETAWIGPRHTNFPDGSICAFTQDDGAWVFGDPIVTLLDLYTVWALRHLYLETFGRWPGRQQSFHPSERLRECRADEYCDCGSSRLYGVCCRPKDLARDPVLDAVQYAAMTGGRERRPPPGIIRAVVERAPPPAVAGLIPPYG